MMASSIEPRVANERLLADPALTYIDVRTVSEFVQGRPLGKLMNIPVAFAHPTTGEFIPNKDFALIVKTLLGENASVLVGGGSDTRPDEAAALLEAAGISSVVVAGGMEAWRAALLPTTRDNRDGVSYVSLLLKVRRPGKAEKTAHAAH
jgi:rhodanese-related sulfurtransferase